MRSGKYEFTHIYSGETLTEIVAPPRGLSRLCSAFLADERVGFDQPIFLHGEENAPPLTFDGVGGIPIADVGGVAYTMPWLGHAEWENVLAVPGTGTKTVLFLLEDAGTLTSQVFMWVGEKQPAAGDPLSRNGLKNGTLYVLAGDDAAPIPRPRSRRRARRPQRIGNRSPGNADVDLEEAAQDAGAFGFVRVEDGAADKKTPGVFYFVTTGSPGTVNPFGRLYRLTFNPANPAGGAGSRTITAPDGSEGIVSPDNIDTNKHGEIVICEDPNYDDATELGLSRDSVSLGLRREHRAPAPDCRGRPGVGIRACNSHTIPGTVAAPMGPLPGGCGRALSSVLDLDTSAGWGEGHGSSTSRHTRCELPRQPKPSKAARFFTSYGSRETSRTNLAGGATMTHKLTTPFHPRRLTRRGFLQRASLGGAALLGGYGTRAFAAANTSPSPRAALPIEHVIISCQENRSFDHYFGFAPQVQAAGFGPPAGLLATRRQWRRR